MLDNKCVLVTGALAGIGAAVARQLADVSDGHVRLVLAARRLDRLKALQQELTDKFPHLRSHIAPLDVGDVRGAGQFLESLPPQFSEIDVLINNAGKALGREEVGLVADEDIAAMFNTNVLGLIALTQKVLPQMKARNLGDIVNLGSIAGRDPYPGGGIYCPTKAAVKSFSSVLRKELISTKIRVIEVDPGNVETEFSNVRFRGDAEKAKAVYAGTDPLVADDIADVIVFALTRRQNVVMAETLVFSTNQASAVHLHRM